MIRYTFSRKRNLTIFAFSTRMFFMGVEYAVIFPSVWLYLKTFHVEYWYLGLVLSAYNMVGIVSTAIVGRLVDVTRKVKIAGFFWNLAEISGNFIYSMPFWVGFPLIGRMIAGFGEGFISAMWGELARVTTVEQRTRYFAILKGCNLLGAAIGPAFNLFLREINFNIGKWPIDYRTSPGFVMGLIWIIVTLLMIFCVFDLSWELENNPNYQLLLEEPTTSLKLPDRHEKKKSVKDDDKSPRQQTEEIQSSPIKETRKKSPSRVKSRVRRLIPVPRSSDVTKKTLLSIANEARGERKIDGDSDPSLLVEVEKINEESDDPTIYQPPSTPITVSSDPIPSDPIPSDPIPSDPFPKENDIPHPFVHESTKIQHNPFDDTSDPSSESEPEEAIEIQGDVSFKVAIKDMFSKFHVVVMIYLLFFMYVIHTCLQGISPLIGENELSWSENQVSIFYTAWGLEIILVLVVVWLISPKISDRVILLFAVVCGCFSTLSLIILSYSAPASNICLYSFIITIFLAGIGISITVVVGRSLVSKHTEAANQGLVHAILTSFNRIAGLSGPIFGSSLYKEKTTMAWLLALVQLIGLILVLFAYKKLKVVK